MRFVLKPGPGADPGAAAALAGVEVVDRIGGTLLVESDEATLAGHVAALAGWTIGRETRFAQPRPVRYTIGEA